MFLFSKIWRGVLLDDAFVLGFVVKQLSGEIDKYKKFKGFV